MADGETTPEPEPVPPLHRAAQEGDLQKLCEILESGASPNLRDAEGITALHWAAMNRHLLCCSELLNRGAEVDPVGGELRATPLHWATRSGHIYVVHLLIRFGANASLLEGQGYNGIHLAVHSHSPTMVAYYVTQGLVEIDTVDAAGRTALQWACYQGDQLSVKLLLQAGADPNKQDSDGLTAVHWSAVKGSVNCIMSLVEGGGDPRIKDNKEQNAVELAKKLNSIPAWRKAMSIADRTEDGRPIPHRLDKRQTNVIISILPTFVLFLIFSTLNTLPWYTGCLVAAAEAFGMQHVIVRVLLPQNSVHGGVVGAMQRSPYLCAIMCGSIVWVAWCWLTRLVNGAPGYAYTHLTFALSFLICAYNLTRAITMDPGFLQQNRVGDKDAKEIVEELVSAGNFNGQNFCLTCMARTPLRSRHCKNTNRCVARFDHSCPWINNAVGLNNHRQFVIFVAALIVGVIAFDRLTYLYFLENVAWDSPIETSCILPSPICASSTHDTFLFSVALWASIQLTWTLVLLAGHVYQIMRQLTTYELSNLGRYGYIGGKGGQSLMQQEGHRHPHAPSDSLPLPATSGHRHGPECKHEHRNPLSMAKACCASTPNTLLSIVGLDLYTRGKAAEGIAKAEREGGGANPFDVGVISNCMDFWSRGRTIGIDYMQVYDVPPGGFRNHRPQGMGTPKIRRGEYEMVGSHD